MSEVNVNYGYNNGHIGDNYTIHNSGSGSDELFKLLSQIQSTMDQADITTEEREEAAEYFAVIKEEAEKDNPRTHFIKTACSGLKNIISSSTFWNLVDKFLLYFS